MRVRPARPVDHSARPELDVPPHESYALAHEVWLEKDTLLGKLMMERLNGADTCDVNSRHHQAVKVIGAGLAATAHATDGIVEAIEAPDLPFCVGVQWHPENFWRTGEFLPLFRLFAGACVQRIGARA